MLRCKKCEEAIDDSRIKAFLSLTKGVSVPDLCKKCAEEQGKNPIVGFMVMSGEKGARKVGAELMTISPVNNPNYKEQIRQAERVKRRAR